jgi:hypothetical protein
LYCTIQIKTKSNQIQLSDIIAAFAAGSCSIEFIMQFCYAGYEINSSEADQIKNAAITGIRHLFPEHLHES